MFIRVFPHHLSHSVRALHCSALLQIKKQCTIEKRAEMLRKLIKNNEHKKSWHLQIGATGFPDKNIYNKVPRPQKRASILNSLFMKSITDVMSTGEICPEIMGYGIEITGVRVTSDYQIVNVYYQMPDVKEANSSNVEEILARSAPDIRGELIRRNVLGKVPRIYFIRDPTNKRMSDFQKCLEASRITEIEHLPSLPAEELLKNVYQFTEGRGVIEKKNIVEEPEKPKVQASMAMPDKPPDMKIDVMGLNHEEIFNRVVAAKKKPKELPEATLPVVSHDTEDGEKLKNCNIIQADPLFHNTDREKLIKKFCIDQKTKWAKVNKYGGNVERQACDMMLPDTADDTMEEDFEEDYFEEEDWEEQNKDTGHTYV